MRCVPCRVLYGPRTPVVHDKVQQAASLASRYSFLQRHLWQVKRFMLALMLRFIHSEVGPTSGMDVRLTSLPEWGEVS